MQLEIKSAKGDVLFWQIAKNASKRGDRREKMKEDIVTLTIDGQEIKVPKGTTILQAAKQAGIDIPTLCFLKDINEVGD